MRKIACFLLLGCATLGYTAITVAAEAWRWKDVNGVVHYSDRPTQGAERVDISATKPSSSPPNIVVTREPGTAPAAAAGTPNIPYTRCVIIAPDAEETFNAVNAVTAGVYVEPKLQDGHRIEVMLNGRIVTDWPPDALTFTLTQMVRGSYTISARVLDANGGTACSGPTLTFHVRQPTVPQVRPRPPGG